MVSTFAIVTRTDAPIGRLFAASLDIDAHQASMSASKERAIEGVTGGMQTRGPFRRFHHEHSFVREWEETVMIDTPTLASPLFGRNEHLVRSLGATGSVV